MDKRYQHRSEGTGLFAINFDGQRRYEQPESKRLIE